MGNFKNFEKFINGGGGGGIKISCGGGVQKSRKNICSPPIYFEPESTCTIIYIHTYIYTYIHAYIHTCIHTYMHIHLIQKVLSSELLHCALRIVTYPDHKAP